MSSYLWYDFETFGLDTRSDRPAQFAAIRTDMELNVIGEPINLFCKPGPDYVPNPAAVMVTGITPQFCEEKGLSEREFANAVRLAKSQPGTIAVGYNTIKFDSEVTRFMLWRNLMDPYEHEWKNSCARWDLLPVVQAFYGFGVPGIVWPQGEDGQLSIRLEQLTAANGLSHTAAHDALSDVQATLDFARLLRSKNPRLFDYCATLRQKDAVKAQFGTGYGNAIIHVTPRAGKEKGYLSLVLPIGPHPDNASEIVVWDLAHDPVILKGLSAAEIRSKMYVAPEDFQAGVRPIALRTIKANASPVVLGKLSMLASQAAAKWGFDIAGQAANAERVKEAFAELVDANGRGFWREVFKREPVINDPDAALYDGFVSAADRACLNLIRATPADQLARVVPSLVYTEKRVEEIAFRYRARNFPESLNATETARWDTYLHTRLHGDSTRLRTIGKMQEEIATLKVRHADDPKKTQALNDLAEYGEQLSKHSALEQSAPELAQKEGETEAPFI